MAKNITIRNNRTGATGTKAINDARKRLSSLSERAVKGLPGRFNATIANITRGFFKQNFAIKEDWHLPFYSGKYQYKKNTWLRRGDFFEIGKIGLAPIVHGSEAFGRLTDTTMDTVGSRAATIVKTNKKRVKGGMNLFLSVGLDKSKFEGGNKHYNGKTGKKIREIDVNQLLAFSHRVTKPGSPDSVFVRITPEQKRKIKKYISVNFKKIVKRVYLRKTA